MLQGSIVHIYRSMAYEYQGFRCFNSIKSKIRNITVHVIPMLRHTNGSESCLCLCFCISRMEYRSLPCLTRVSRGHDQRVASGLWYRVQLHHDVNIFPLNMGHGHEMVALFYVFVDL